LSRERTVGAPEFVKKDAAVKTIMEAKTAVEIASPP
jgi:hypothetical protein